MIGFFMVLMMQLLILSFLLCVTPWGDAKSPGPAASPNFCNARVSSTSSQKKAADVYLQIITVKTQAHLDQVLALLSLGQNFSALAQNHSTHLSAGNGGIWGPVRLDELPDSVRAQVEKAEQEAVVNFFEPALGYTILRKLNADLARKLVFEQTLNRGVRHLQLKEKDLALRELKKAVALDPQSAAAHEFLGQAYMMQDTYEMRSEAKAEFVQAIAINPASVWPRFYLSWIYLDLGQSEKAVEQLEAALKIRPNVPQLLSLLGEANRKLGNIELAIEQNQKALEADLSFFPARYYLALAYLDLEKEEDAVRELEAALTSGYAAPEVCLTLGTVYVRRGKLDEAVTLYQKALAADPARPEGHLRLAKAYRLKKRLDLALAELERAEPEAQGGLSMTYYQNLITEISLERGLVYRETGAVTQAVEAFLKVLELNPDHCQAHRQLAEMLLMKRARVRARRHAEKAKQLNCPAEPLSEKI